MLHILHPYTFVSTLSVKFLLLVSRWIRLLSGGTLSAVLGADNASLHTHSKSKKKTCSPPTMPVWRRPVRLPPLALAAFSFVFLTYSRVSIPIHLLKSGLLLGLIHFERPALWIRSAHFFRSIITVIAAVISFGRTWTAGNRASVFRRGSWGAKGRASSSSPNTIFFPIALNDRRVSQMWWVWCGRRFILYFVPSFWRCIWIYNR